MAWVLLLLLVLTFASYPLVALAETTELFDRLKKLEIEIQAEGFAAVKNVPEINKPDEDGWTPLMHAAFNGHVEMVKSFLVAGAKADMVNYKGETALMMAVQQRHYHTTAALLRAPSANLYQRNRLGANLLHQAIAGGLFVIVETILATDRDRRSNPDVHEPSVESLSVEMRREMEVRLVDTALSGVGGSTLTGLMMACQDFNIEVVKSMLRHGVNVNLQSSTGETALMFASTIGHTQLVELLLQHGAVTTVATKEYKFTALMLASARGHVEITKLLAQHAEDRGEEEDGLLDMADSAGHTALDHANDARPPQQKVIDVLVSFGIDLGDHGAPFATQEVLDAREEALERRRLRKEKVMGF
jgi:ankyrin repeat protein